MSDVYLALGSNQNNPIAEVRLAIDALRAHPEITITKVSSLYHSLPWGNLNQDNYINAVAKVHTLLSPHALLGELQHIEKIHGRVRVDKWGPRTIDLDILLFDRLQLNSPELTIPHLYLAEREFVVYPLHEIEPDLILPNGKSIQQLLKLFPNVTIQKIQEGLTCSASHYTQEHSTPSPMGM